MSRVGVFASPEEAREFKQLLQQLRASGFQLAGGQQKPPVIDQQDTTVIYNASGLVIPPCAIVQCVGARSGVIEVRRPADRYGVNGPYLINGRNAIKIGERGVAYSAGNLLVHTNGTPTALTRLSPEANQWYAIANPAGNIIVLGKDAIRATPFDVQYRAMVGEFPTLIHAKTGIGGVAAASGTSTRTMGSASCTLYQSSSAGVLTATSLTITLYNQSATAVGGSRFVGASQNEKGLWVITIEDCT